MPERYLDSKGEITATRANIAKAAQFYFKKAQNFTKEENVKASDEAYFISDKLFKEALMFGDAPSSYFLAAIYHHGLQVQQDKEKAQLYLLIGAELKNKDCLSIIDKNIDKKGLLTDYVATNPQYSEELLTYSKSHASKIEMNSKENNSEIDYFDVRNAWEYYNHFSDGKYYVLTIPFKDDILDGQSYLYGKECSIEPEEPELPFFYSLQLDAFKEIYSNALEESIHHLEDIGVNLELSGNTDSTNGCEIL